MNRIVNEQKKRIRHLYSFMFRRYRTNTLADGGTISYKPVLGPELIPDASRWFNIDNDPYWTKSETTTISSGIATFNSLSSNWHLYNTSAIKIGKTYSITYTILTRTAGYLIAQAGNTLAIGRGSTGTFTEILTCSVNSRVGFTSADFVGTIDNISVREVLINSITTDYLKMAQNNRMDKSIRFGWLGEAGSKIESGKVSKAYSFDFNNYQNNATQTTPTSRPYLTGNIAPNEKLGLKNPNGGSNFMTHPTISFGANESWSVTFAINNSFSNLFTPQCFIRSTAFTNNSMIRLGSSLEFWNESSSSTSFTALNIHRFIGKTVVFTLVADGVGNISLYANGVFIETKSRATNFTFNSIFDRETGLPRYFGIVKSHIIRSQALTQQQVTAEYTYLRSVYPEIESVDIGTQTWATSNCEMAATPQGNVIQEMQAAGNVEKITNGGFTNDLSGWSYNPTYYTYVNGRAKYYSATESGFSSIGQTILSIGKYYKLTFSYEVVTGAIQCTQGSTTISGALVGTGTYSLYFLASQTTLNFGRSFTGGGAEFYIDNISVQEIGWSGSQELYDGIYAQTAGTVEQKTYAAVKAAGFWCHYNNSVDNGAIYGKLYNWFAVKLLQMDIDYFNAANPTTPWGWKVPTQADFNTLATTLGGITMAGGKMKMPGTTYWNSLNVGGTNESGFSSIGGGIRMEDGTNFATYPTGSFGTYHTLTEEAQTTAVIASTSNLHAQLTIVATSKIRGRSLRLIKTT